VNLFPLFACEFHLWSRRRNTHQFSLYGVHANPTSATYSTHREERSEGGGGRERTHTHTHTTHTLTQIHTHTHTHTQTRKYTQTLPHSLHLLRWCSVGALAGLMPTQLACCLLRVNTTNVFASPPRVSVSRSSSNDCNRYALSVAQSLTTAAQYVVDSVADRTRRMKPSWSLV
jgi:hypothetical protein